MRQINYILVCNSAAKGSDREPDYRDVPNVGLCVVVSSSPKFKVPGSKERATLIDQLVRLRRHWPEAPILGVSELDTSSSHAPVRVSEAMNQLRRELSDPP